jgi:phosphoribosylglycinamide formyltransferase-1
MLNIGVMVSGGGTNLQAILDAVSDGRLPGCRVVTVVSSRADAGALARAERAGIPHAVFSRKTYADPAACDAAVLAHMQTHGVQLVVLAGYLSMIGAPLLKAYPGAILNVHPSLIPAFCGKGFYGLIPHVRALEYGVKVTGATVHFVEPEYDSGPIVLQKAVPVLADDTPEILQRRVMEQAEWELLPEAIRLFSEGRLVMEGRKVLIR